MSTAFESATWDDAHELLGHLREHGRTRGKAAAHDLRRFADDMFDERAARVGPMPFEVESFIRAYTARAIPPNFPKD